MTGPQYETLADEKNHPQVNKVRGEYVNGDMSEEELEEQLETSLSEGPSLCSETDLEEPLTSSERIAALAQLPLILSVVALCNRFDGGAASYDRGTHTVSLRDTDPSPDSHPAENAGMMKLMFDFGPLLLYLVPLQGVSQLQLGGLEKGAVVLLASLIAIALWSPGPTVRYTVEGVGTHVAEAESKSSTEYGKLEKVWEKRSEAALVVGGAHLVAAYGYAASRYNFLTGDFPIWAWLISGLVLILAARFSLRGEE